MKENEETDHIDLKRYLDRPIVVQKDFLVEYVVIILQFSSHSQVQKSFVSLSKITKHTKLFLFDITSQSFYIGCHSCPGKHVKYPNIQRKFSYPIAVWEKLELRIQIDGEIFLKLWGSLNGNIFLNHFGILRMSAQSHRLEKCKVILRNHTLVEPNTEIECPKEIIMSAFNCTASNCAINFHEYIIYRNWISDNAGNYDVALAVPFGTV